MNVITRGVEEGDAAQVARIYNQGIEDRIATFETSLRTAAEEREVIRSSAGRLPFVVAESDGELVAWARVFPYRDRSCYRGVGECSVYVGRAHRGRGLGRLVLEALLSEAERMGYWKLVSRIFPHNAGSRALCQAAGFREVGVYHKHAKLDGLWLDTVIVERLIDANLT